MKKIKIDACLKMDVYGVWISIYFEIFKMVKYCKYVILYLFKTHCQHLKKNPKLVSI